LLHFETLAISILVGLNSALILLALLAEGKIGIRKRPSVQLRQTKKAARDGRPFFVGCLRNL
jgi:hypothetical protein